MINAVRLLAEYLKKHGYRKRGLNWAKENEGVTILFSIMKSQFSKEVWYYSFGIRINDLDSRNSFSINHAHIRFQISNEAISSIDGAIALINKWEACYGSIDKLITIVSSEEHRGTWDWCTGEAYNYLYTKYITAIIAGKGHRK